MASGKKVVRYAVVDERGGQIGVLVDLEEYERLQQAARELEELRRRGKRPSDHKPKKRKFADLAGSLRWKGDALAEQRRLRGEW